MSFIISVEGSERSREDSKEAQQSKYSIIQEFSSVNTMQNFHRSTSDSIKNIEKIQLFTDVLPQDQNSEEIICKIYTADNADISHVDYSHYEKKKILHKVARKIRLSADGLIKKAKKSFRYIYSKKNGIQKDCAICYEESLTHWNLPDCNNLSFCIDCIKYYIEVQIKEYNILKIPCPCDNCTKFLSKSDILQFIPLDLYTKYEQILERRLLAQEPTVKFCITPNCDGIIKKSPTETKRMCPICNLEMCFDCGKFWHEGKTCEQKEDLEYKSWAYGKNIKNCPKCRYKIEKNNGCKHITCIICNCEFCWICGICWYPEHINTDCTEIQIFSKLKNKPISKIGMRTFLYCFLILFCGIPIFFGLGVFCPAYIFTKKVYETHKNTLGKCAIPTIVIVYILALILIPVALGICVACFPFFICYYFYSKCKFQNRLII